MSPKFHLISITLVLWILTSTPASAEVRVPRIFSDQMVLQQETSNAFWGWGTPGKNINVEASWGESVSTTVSPEGRWKLFLPTPSHGTGFQVTISGGNQIRLKNVAIGEVWLCAGQSNMGWSTGNSFEAEGETNVDLPGFRIFKSQREHWHEPLEESRDLLKRWKPCTPESAAETSAVSYYFGKTLHQHLKVPVGIIVQAYAGTPIEGWMPWQLQADDPRAIAHKEQMDINSRRQRGRGDTIEKGLATWQEEFAVYQRKIASGETMKNRFRVLQPPFITKPASLGHQYPAHIFNAMVYPIRPFGIRGMIWYQGERNSKNVPQAVHYETQIARLIGYYRSSWHELSAGNVSDDFPVQLTQLPSWNPPQQEPVEGLSAPWAANRESMRLASESLPNAGLVVSIDTGDEIALHPKNKKPIGIRHALLALNKTYRRVNIVGSGPRVTDYRRVGNRVTLTFGSIGSGLMAGRGENPDAFALADQNGSWHWAKATIDGNAVHLTAEDVRQPTGVRYAWAMNPSQRSLLYNREGLPASPFRTDSQPLFREDEDLMDVLKPEKPEGYVSKDWSRPAMPQAQANE